MIELNDENYYTRQSDIDYMSYSQFKQFETCEAAALAVLNGETKQQPPTTAQLVGSYVDAFFDGTLDEFKTKNPQIFKKDGSLKADFTLAEKIIERVQRDEMFMKYMNGEKQVIQTGEIAGVPFKIKMDSYHPGRAIVDLKCMRDINPIWDDQQHARVPFADAYGYTIQAAIYREIVRQNTGDTLPYFLAVATKQDEPDINLMFIPDDVMDEQLAHVMLNAPHIQDVKIGKVPPMRCGKCAYCRKTKIITEIIDYRDATN